jgi:hypothetical protein
MDYHNDIQSVLTAISRSDRPQSSGAAVALTLSVGIECLALHLSLSTRADGADPHRYHTHLAGRIDEWREAAQRAFLEDPVHVGDVIDARRAQRMGPDGGSQQNAERELDALHQANAVLLRLMEVSIALEDDASEMLRGRGVAHARAEAATAMHLAEAATRSLTSMLVTNVATARARAADFDLVPMDVRALEEIVERIPHEKARMRLGRALATLDSASR